MDNMLSLKLEVEHEEMVFDFVEANPDLYNKGDTDFMKLHRKDPLWQHIAVTL